MTLFTNLGLLGTRRTLKKTLESTHVINSKISPFPLVLSMRDSHKFTMETSSTVAHGPQGHPAWTLRTHGKKIPRLPLPLSMNL